MTGLQERLNAVSRKTLLQAVEWSNQQAGIKPGSFQFARLDSWNEFKDSFNFNDYPAHVTMPWETKMVWLNGRVKSVMNMEGWIITRVPQKATDYKEKKMEELYLQPMRVIAKSFIRNLLDCEIIDQEVTPVNVTITPEYMWLDANLFGVSYKASIPVLEQVY